MWAVFLCLHAHRVPADTLALFQDLKLNAVKQMLKCRPFRQAVVTSDRLLHVPIV